MVAFVGSLAVLGVSVLCAELRAEEPSRAPLLPLPAGRSGDMRKIALGRDLFYDRRLSHSMTVSCQSCHDLSTNGASSVAVNRSDAGRQLSYNTPTVFNAVYSFRLGWEGKTRSLRDFAMGTLGTDHLMGGDGLAARRLAADPKMVARFREIYRVAPSEDRIADALSVFMATLVTPDAPFDRWLRGDKTALTAQQVRGYDRFQQLGCASCHQGANVGANIFQRRGIFHPLGAPNPRYLRVPSLRNVAATAPYFHDGSVSTLPDAIRRMARAQLDLTISERDLSDVTAFLDSLTGTYRGHLVRAAPDRKR